MYYLRRILGCIKRADEEYKLIEDGDKIAVGVSGGKDSVLLLYALNAYKRMVEKEKTFEIIGLHINLGFPNMDLAPLKDYFSNMNIPFEVEDTDIAKILELNRANNGRLPCSICSRMKKAVIIKFAKEHNCNKVSFAHHGDDAIETLLMNAIYGGRIATFSPKMYLDRSEITFIRPFVYARENEITKSANKVEVPIVKSTCPNDKETQRAEMKKMLHNLYHNYPTAKDNFLLMLHNPSKLDLWNPIKKDSKHEDEL